MGSELTKFQRRVLHEMFVEMKGEREALETVGISDVVYRRWLASDAWKQEFEGRMAGCRRQARLILSSYMVLAATKLVTLVDCDKEATSRQACLDILGMKDLAGEEAGEPVVPEGGRSRLNGARLAAIMRLLADTEEKKGRVE